MKVRRAFIFVFLLMTVIAAAYMTSFAGGFFLDDHGRILQNPVIRSPRVAATTLSLRYVVELTFAWDYFMGGVNPAHFHFTNLVIHLSCALTLFLLVRALAVISGKEKNRAEWIAFISALLWGVHPLCTSSVTYICQRYESLMTLFYLLAMFLLVKGAGTGPRRYVFLFLSVASFFCGIFAKQVIITAPLVLLLLDASFLSGTLRGALRRRWPYYAALGACWALQLALIYHRSDAHGAMFHSYAAELGTGLYLLNQAPVLLQYLYLVFWPSPLTLDYAWQPVLSVSQLAFPAAVVAGMFIAVGLGFVKWPKRFFAGVCAFVILSPTSSFIPIPDLAYEHRMYLPLACIIVSLILLVDRGTRGHGIWNVLSLSAALIIATGLGIATYERNRDYSDPKQFWGEIKDRIPHNFRAWTFYVGETLDRGDYRGAEIAARQLISRVQMAEAGDSRVYNIPSSSPEMYRAFGQNLLGRALMGLGRKQEALALFSEIVSAHPDDVAARHNRALALLALGFDVEAEYEINEALRVNPAHVEAGMIKVRLLSDSGRHREAVALLERILASFPGLVAAKVEMAWLLCSSYDDKIRDAGRARSLFQDAEEQIGVTSARLFDLRAAVSAEEGDFVRAREYQEAALSDARQHFDAADSRISDMEIRLSLYREDRPFRFGAASRAVEDNE